MRGEHWIIWMPFLHPVPQYRNPKGVVALLILSEQHIYPKGVVALLTSSATYTNPKLVMALLTLSATTYKLWYLSGSKIKSWFQVTPCHCEFHASLSQGAHHGHHPERWQGGLGDCGVLAEEPC